MDKISSIISSSQSKVDMSKERPVRAGAPSYGQPVSPATKTFEKKKVEEAAATTQFSVESQRLPSPDVQRHTGMIDKITLSFKGNSERTEPVEQVIDLSTLEAGTSEGSLVESEEPSQSLDLYA